MRETLSQLYLELADYFEAKYSLLTQHTDPQTALPPLLVRQQKVMDLISLLYQQLNFLPHANNLEQSACSAPFRWRWTCRSTSPSACICRKRCKTGGAEPAEAIIRRNAQVIAGRLRAVAHDILYHQHSKRFSMTHELAALENGGAASR